MTQEIATELNNNILKLLAIFKPETATQSERIGLQMTERDSSIYIGTNGESCWYALSSDNQKVPIYEDCIIGVLTGINLREQISDKYGSTIKLELLLKCGQKQYRIVSRTTTVFSKSIIASFLTKQLDPGSLIRIQVRAGESQGVVLAAVYDEKTNRIILGQQTLNDKEIEYDIEDAAIAMDVPFKGLGNRGKGGNSR